MPSQPSQYPNSNHGCLLPITSATLVAAALIIAYNACKTQADKNTELLQNIDKLIAILTQECEDDIQNCRCSVSKVVERDVMTGFSLKVPGGYIHGSTGPGVTSFVGAKAVNFNNNVAMQMGGSSAGSFVNLKGGMGRWRPWQSDVTGNTTMFDANTIWGKANKTREAIKRVCPR